MSNIQTTQKAHKLHTNRGQRRIWLENSTLAKYGFNRGDAIDVQFSDSTLTIKLTDSPARHAVAGRERNGRKISIIDLNSQQVTDLAGDAAQINVSYAYGLLILSPIREG